MKRWLILIPVISITTFLKSAARKTIQLLNQLHPFFQNHFPVVSLLKVEHRNYIQRIEIMKVCAGNNFTAIVYLSGSSGSLFGFSNLLWVHPINVVAYPNIYKVCSEYSGISFFNIVRVLRYAGQDPE